MIIKDIDTEKRVFLIAEIGNNHEGSVDLAEEMIHRAAAAGTDAVKFQTFRTADFVSPVNPERFKRLKSFELSYGDFAHLAGVARSCGIVFLSTPLDIESATFLNTLVPAFKIASADNTFYPMLAHVAAMNKPILLSGGLLTIEGLHHSVDFIKRIWNQNATNPGLALLHCVTAYPVPDSEANLSAIRTLQDNFDITIGYSDHSLGTLAALSAVTLGARIIEKHFTLRKDYSDFRDHQLSADPDEFAALARDIRRIEMLVGDGLKTPSNSESMIERDVRRSIAASHPLTCGHCLTPRDLTWVRPGGGIPPGQEDQLLGRRLKQDIQKGQIITSSMIAGRPCAE